MERKERERIEREKQQKIAEEKRKVKINYFSYFNKN